MTSLVVPGAFTITLSIALLTAAVIGGLAACRRAAGQPADCHRADLRHRRGHQPRAVQLGRLQIPIAVYGVVLILVMLAFPQGIQGGLHRLLTLFTGPEQKTPIPRDASAPHVTPLADEAPRSHHEKEGTA